MTAALPTVVQGVVLGVLLVSSAVWLGGWVALVVVSRSTSATLDRAARVAFFRHFGRRWGIVSTVALLLAYATGGMFLFATTWDSVSTWLVVLAVTLLVILGPGVLQARRMSRLRRAALAAPADEQLASRVRSSRRAAVALRGGIGLLSLAMLVLAVTRVV